MTSLDHLLPVIFYKSSSDQQLTGANKEERKVKFIYRPFLSSEEIDIDKSIS